MVSLRALMTLDEEMMKSPSRPEMQEHGLHVVSLVSAR